MDPLLGMMEILMPLILERVAAAGARAGGLPCEVQQRIPVCISGGQRGGHQLFLARLHVFLHEGAAAPSCLPDPGAYPSLCITPEARRGCSILPHEFRQIHVSA